MRLRSRRKNDVLVCFVWTDFFCGDVHVVPSVCRILFQGITAYKSEISIFLICISAEKSKRGEVFDQLLGKEAPKKIKFTDKPSYTVNVSRTVDGDEYKPNKFRYVAKSKVKEEAIKLKGLKLFFREFTLIDEKEAIEVKVWKDYLIFAQILGMASTVAKQFKKLYPDVIPDDYMNDFIFIYAISNDGLKSASAAKSRAENYSSGGGGSSFGGGGGGSFGGGGGGFR